MKKKVLFIDRDGTLVIEPPIDYQLDAFEKLEFYPKVFRNLHFIRQKLDFEFVMVTNQDGLGTSSFPENTFWPVHNLVMKTFANEGITFDEVFIDRSFPEDNAPTRKPRTGMLTRYLNNEEYDNKKNRFPCVYVGGLQPEYKHSYGSIPLLRRWHYCESGAVGTER